MKRWDDRISDILLIFCNMPGLYQEVFLNSSGVKIDI